MNNQALNTSVLGGGQPNYKVGASASTVLAIENTAAQGSLRAGAKAATSVRITSEVAGSALIRSTRVSTKLQVSAETTITMYRAIYGVTSTRVAILGNANGALQQNASAQSVLSVSSYTSPGYVILASAYTDLRLYSTNTDGLVYGSAAPAERQMVVQQEDRSVVV